MSNGDIFNRDAIEFVQYKVVVDSVLSDGEYVVTAVLQDQGYKLRGDEYAPGGIHADYTKKWTAHVDRNGHFLSGKAQINSNFDTEFREEASKPGWKGSPVGGEDTLMLSWHVRRCFGSVPDRRMISTGHEWKDSLVRYSHPWVFSIGKSAAGSKTESGQQSADSELRSREWHTYHVDRGVLDGVRCYKLIDEKTEISYFGGTHREKSLTTSFIRESDGLIIKSIEELSDGDNDPNRIISGKVILDCR
jgi:hypothetical protein